MNTIKNIIFICLIAQLHGCSTSTSYFEAKRDYADILDEFIGGNNSKFKILAINGPVYKVGKVMTPGSTEPLTSNCYVPDDFVEDVAMVPLPPEVGNMTFKISTNATLPDSIEKVVGDAELNALLDVGASSNLRYTGQNMKSVDTKKLEAVMRNEACIKDILDESIVIIRGYIEAKENWQSNKGINAGGDVKIKDVADLEIKFDLNGNYEIIDKAPIERYYIVAQYKPITKKEVEDAGSIQDFVLEESSFELDQRQINVQEEFINNYYHKNK